MLTRKIGWGLCGVVLLLIMAKLAGPWSLAEGAASGQSLASARAGFTTTLVHKRHVGEAAPEPLRGVFDLVKYHSPAGDLAAYVSHPPADGQKHPIILWVVGGFSNSISEIAWEPQPPENDQSASVFREAGVLMMYPSLRGGNDNPGAMETFYGEVDDLLAARDYAAKLPFVDPARIYVGGHSTGGTLVLLTVECASGFRAAFAFGPVKDARGYGSDTVAFDVKNRQEGALRAPGKWLAGIRTPTFVFEGEGGRSNIESLRALEAANRNPLVTFHPIPKASHFSGLRPVSRLIAHKILADSGPTPNIAFSKEEIASALAP